MYIDNQGNLHVGKFEVPDADHLLDCQFGDPELMGTGHCVCDSTSIADCTCGGRKAGDTDQPLPDADPLGEEQRIQQQRAQLETLKADVTRAINFLEQFEKQLHDQKVRQDAVADYITRILSRTHNNTTNDNKDKNSE